ncbi:MAG: dockerin type I domain-containing protein [candidate division Zixibacteria bacterium]|nr:dockerin type I domain-containing protein [candidate division Zixibacteria bacterium]
MKFRSLFILVGILLVTSSFLPGLTFGSGQDQVRERERKIELIQEKGEKDKLNYRGMEIPVYNGNGAALSQEQRRTILTIIDDFKVNSNAGLTDQNNSAIATDGSGNFIITWQDKRNGNWGIYAQRFNSSGTPLGTNFKVNDDVGTADQRNPAIALDGAGSFVITWQDLRNGGVDIYAQRYNSSGTPLGTNFKVNDDVGAGLHTMPAIALDGPGNFVITWTDYRNGNGDIYARRYNSSGTPLGASFKANDDIGTTEQFTSAIALDGSGNFVITWQDYRNGNWDIYAQRYNSSGTPLGTNFKANDDVGTTEQSYPAIAMNGSGNFAITWGDRRNGNLDIYTQRYNSSGTPLGTNFKVNDDAGTAAQYYTAISMDGSGNFVITWQDYRNGNLDIFAQRYNSSGTPLGTNFKVNDDAGTATQASSAIAMNGSGNFVITWDDYRSVSNADIYAQRYNSSGTPQGSNFKVNTDTRITLGDVPAIAVNGSGDFVITWEDYPNGNADIYCQRYNSSGTPQGSNFKVNDDNGTADQRHPDIALDGSGNFVITWMDYRSGSTNADIYAQAYNSSGTPLGPNFKVNSDATTQNQWYPKIAMDGSGNFVITWYDYRSVSNADIYAQRYNSSGTLQGPNFKVNDDVGTLPQYFPDVAMDGSGNFVITWMDYRSASYADIYAQRYNSSGTPQSSNFKVNTNAGTTQWYPAIAMNSSGNFVITWEDFISSGISNILAQRYNSSGTPQGSNFKVNDNTGIAQQLYPDIAINGSGDFIITWEDNRKLGGGSPDAYAQRYKSSGSPFGLNYLVANSLYSAYAQYKPSVGMNGSNIYFTWKDSRNDSADIYAKVVGWAWPYACGDANGDGNVTVSDVVYLSNYLFKGGPAPQCPPAPYLTCGDANGDGQMTVSDMVYLVNYLFKGGPPPVC